MNLDYPGKMAEEYILQRKNIDLISGLEKTAGFLNRILIFGDNINAMKSLLFNYGLKERIDLVYIDPPFASRNEFRVGKNRTSTMSTSAGDVVAYTDFLEGAEYLEFLRQRLVLIRELMSEKASIYLHIDYKIGHYVKLIMDEVFGRENFRHDITRIKCNPKNFSRRGFGNIKDLILMYTKSDNFTWNEPYEVRGNEDIARLFKKLDSSGRKYTTNPLHAPGETATGESGKPWRGLEPPKGRHWRYSHEVLDDLEAKGLIEWSKNGVPRKKIFAEDFPTKKVQDIWNFKDKPNPIYPTEKNLHLLKRIIETSSNAGDLVLDAFCGSGGFLYVAEQLDRRWMGIDSSPEAIKVANSRLKEDEQSLFVKQEIINCRV